MKITEAIKEVGRPVQFYPSLAKVFGIEEAIFIGQLLYWKGKEADKRGIRKSIGEIESETALSVKQQKRIKEKLQKQGCLKYEYDRSGHNSYYQIFESKINEIYQRYSPKGYIPKGNEVSSQRDEGIVPKGISSIHRIHKEYSESKNPPLKTTPKYLLEVPFEDIQQFKAKYDVSKGDIKTKADKLYNYCLAHGKEYQNYKAVLRNALNSDFGLK